MINYLINSQIFSIFITMLTIYLFNKLSSHLKMPLLNPLALGSLVLVLFISFTPLTVETYFSNTAILRFFVGILTVAFALPLYKNIKIIIKKWYLFLIGTLVSVFASIGFTILFSRLFGLDEIILKSILGKTLTTPFAVDISNYLNALVSLTVVSVVVSGISGAIFAPLVFKVFKINSAIAQGFSVGSVSHVLGSVTIADRGEIQLASASIAITLVGVFTAFFIKMVNVV